MSRKSIAQALWRCLCEDRGQDLVEYALLTGFVSVATLLALSVLVPTMEDAYDGWNTGAYEAWEPPDPLDPGS